MPLLAGGRVLGLVELSDYVPRDFAPDLELIRGLGQVAGHALENAALFEQVERRSRVLNELVELGRAGQAGRATVATLLRTAAERLLTAVDAANCDIFQARDEGLRCVASYDRSGATRHRWALLDLAHYPTVLAAHMNAHQVLVITSPDDPQLSEAERGAYREYGFASEVCVPLVVNDQLYGLIDIYDTRERDYTEYLSFLQSAGQILAGALRERPAVPAGRAAHRPSSARSWSSARSRRRPTTCARCCRGHRGPAARHHAGGRLRHLHATGRGAPLPGERRLARLRRERRGRRCSTSTASPPRRWRSAAGRRWSSPVSTTRG